MRPKKKTSSKKRAEGGAEEDPLVGQASSLLLHVKPGDPESAQQAEATGLTAVGGQSELHLQQTLTRCTQKILRRVPRTRTGLHRQRLAHPQRSVPDGETGREQRFQQHVDLRLLRYRAASSAPGTGAQRGEALRGQHLVTNDRGRCSLRWLQSRNLSVERDDQRTGSGRDLLQYLESGRGRADDPGQEQQHVDTRQQLRAVLEKHTFSKTTMTSLSLQDGCKFTFKCYLNVFILLFVQH